MALLKLFALVTAGFVLFHPLVVLVPLAVMCEHPYMSIGIPVAAWWIFSLVIEARERAYFYERGFTRFL
jgi:hypothetical protein